MYLPLLVSPRWSTVEQILVPCWLRRLAVMTRDLKAEDHAKFSRLLRAQRQYDQWVLCIVRSRAECAAQEKSMKRVAEIAGHQYEQMWHMLLCPRGQPGTLGSQRCPNIAPSSAPMARAHKRQQRQPAMQYTASQESNFTCCQGQFSCD